MFRTGATDKSVAVSEMAELILNPDRGHFGFADGGVELLDAFGDDFVLLGE